MLKHYKSDVYAASRRREFTINVAAILGYFLSLHRDCIAEMAGADWNVVTTVPSSGQRTGEHPLVGAVGMLPSLRGEYEELLGPGLQPVGHNIASDDGFTVVGDVDRRLVLVIDDTYTTGSRSQSAASALALAGASVVGIVAVGRVINPGFSETTLAYWAEQRAKPFDFDVCCLEGDA